MKITKSNIISFILGAIMFSGVTVFASNLLSKDITFTPTKEDWQVTTVEEALNSLYEKSQFEYEKIDANSSQGYRLSRTSSITLNKGKYIISVSGTYSGFPVTINNSFSTANFSSINCSNCEYEIITNLKNISSSNKVVLTSTSAYLNVENNNLLYYLEILEDDTEVTATVTHGSVNEQATSSIMIQGFKIK